MATCNERTNTANVPKMVTTGTNFGCLAGISDKIAVKIGIKRINRSSIYIYSSLRRAISPTSVVPTRF